MDKHLKKINQNKLDHLICIIFGVYIFLKIIEVVGVAFTNELLQIVLKICRYFCYAICITKILYDWKNGATITIPILLIGLLTLIISILTNDRMLFLTIIILIALRRVKTDSLIKMAFNVYVFSYFIIVILAILGIIPNWEFSRGNTERYALGFIYPTDAMGMYLVIIMMFFYLKNFNATNLEILTMELINILLYKYTNGRVSFILISIILLIQFLGKYKNIRKMCSSVIFKKIIKMACYLAPIVLFVLFHVMICLYSVNNSVVNKINDLLSDRIKYSYNAYREYNVNLLGNDIEWQGWGAFGYIEYENFEKFKYNFVDSSYVRIVFDYGIIFSSILLLSYNALLINCYEKNDFIIIWIVFFILIWAFIEPYIFDIGKNIFIVLFIPIFEKYPINFLSYKKIYSKICGKE